MKTPTANLAGTQPSATGLPPNLAKLVPTAAGSAAGGEVGQGPDDTMMKALKDATEKSKGVNGAPSGAAANEGFPHPILPGKSPNEPVTDRIADLLEPSTNDARYGVPGAVLGGLDNLNGAQKAVAKGSLKNLQGEFEKLSSAESNMRELAGSTADPKLKSDYLKQAEAAVGELRKNTNKLQNLAYSKRSRGYSVESEQIERISRRRGAKLAKMVGSSVEENAPKLGDRIKCLGPEAERVGQKVANAGINSAVAAGQAGNAISEIGPRAGKLGKLVTSAGVNVGNSAILQGGSLVREWQSWVR